MRFRNVFKNPKFDANLYSAHITLEYIIYRHLGHELILRSGQLQSR